MIPDDQLVSPFPWRPSRRLLERLLLAALLAGMFALKLAHAAHEPDYGPDASYYYDIAAHVRDGHGLVTDVSLFNAGFSYFPHPTAVYPLWPLVLGLSARVVPLDLAATWLPTLFFFAGVLLAYRLARRLAPGPLFPETWPVPHAGHLAALVYGLTQAMFLNTTRPFTEGLAYFLLLLALGRAEALMRAPRAWRGLELGAWLGLIILTRSQLVLAAMAVAGTLAWAVARLGWRRWLAPALAVLLGLAAVLGLQLAHLASFADAPRLAYLLRFDLVREPSELSPLQVMVATDGPLAWLADRARGLPIAFGGGTMSYFNCFGLWAVALPLCLPFLLLDGWRALQRRRLGLWAWLHAPANLFKLCFALLAIGGVLSLHTLHKAMFTPWNFGTRHGLTAGFAIFAAILYLARRPVLGRVIAVFIVAAGTFHGFMRIDRKIRDDSYQHTVWTAAHNQPIVDWLHRRAAAEPGLVVVGPDIEVQKLARFTDGVGYHWLYRTTTWDELDFLLRERGARYLLLRNDRVRRLRLGRDKARFARTFTEVAADLSGFTIYQPRRRGQPRAKWPEPVAAPAPAETTDDN